MKSISTIVKLGTDLTGNTSATNQSLMLQLAGDGQRYLVQKYFDNERSFQTTTIGGQTLTLTSAPNAGVTSATLSALWTYPTGNQLVNFTATTITVALTGSLVAGAVSATLSVVWPYATATVNTTFSSGEVRAVEYINGAAGITWAQALTQTATASITTVSTTDQRDVLFTNGSATITWKNALDSFQTTTIGTVGFQAYPIPAIVSKVTNDTVNVGQLKFVPAPIQTRDEWDKLNFLPYNSDIPGYYFIYNGQMLLFPVPSTTGNLITFNYKARVPDFTFLYQSGTTPWVPGNTPTNYTNGTIATATVGSTSITGTTTSWNTTGKFPLNTDVSFFNLFLRIEPPNGDGFWYPISQFNSDTSLTLALPLNYAPNVVGASYSIGQMPILQEDFHDMLVDYDLMRYFTDIVKNPNSYKIHKESYDTRLDMLKEYAGTKNVNVNLGSRYGARNPNLYPYSQIGIIPN